MPCLLISVRLHDGRYHGRPDWPPSPARLFQALVAGAARGDTLPEEDRRAFAWLEELNPPIINAPLMRAGQSFRNYVPNNDLDAVGGDPERVSKIRAPKLIRPTLFDAEAPLLYVWTIDDAPDAQANARRICAIAEQLYQLGRGIDMAWAAGEILGAEEAEARLAAGGVLHRPSDGVADATLAVPLKGSFESLVLRHKKMRGRFQTLYESKPGKKQPDRKVAIGQIFVQPPKPRFRQVSYGSPPTRLLFDLVGEKASWRLDRIVELTQRVRDGAAQRLKDKLIREAEKVHNALVGRRDANEADKAARVRVTPLPSIGHRHADRAIRRILVEIPPNCPLRADDVAWALSDLLLISDDGEIISELAPAVEQGMLAHYGVGDAKPARLWRTVTPAALPQAVARRRIDPNRLAAEAESGAARLDAKSGEERAGEERRAVGAVAHALRHSGVSSRPSCVRVQREPFDAKGARAEAFAPGTRFAKERLWHVEVAFAEAISGPLVLGDGRYLGLGLMAPAAEARRDVLVFGLAQDARIANADRTELLRAVRRALMALARKDDASVSPLFSGHETDGAKASSGRHRHVFLAVVDRDRDGFVDEVVVAAPWACDRTTKAQRLERAEFDRVASSLATVRAGRLGVISLTPVRIPKAGDRLIGPGRLWESATPYQPTRHARRIAELTCAVEHDVVDECGRRGLPRPRVEMLECSAGPNGGGVSARVRLQFVVAVEGPILIGRDSHAGGGLFETRSLSSPDN